jgi:hypothetical protein
MVKKHFPLIASGIGLLLALVLMRASPSGTGSDAGLPPLTLLFISEFGFFLTAGGAWVAGRAWLEKRNLSAMLMIAACCLILCLAFVYFGLRLWQGISVA